MSKDFWAKLYPVIAVDFDGVLNHYNGWTGQYQRYDIRSGAKEFLAGIKNLGYNIVIFTARPSENLEDVRGQLTEHGMDVYVSMITNVKPPAIVYIDDRGITFKGDYDEMLNAIPTFKAYWEGEEPADGPTEEQRIALGLGE